MQKMASILKNEEGSVLLVGVMILLLLTIIGIAATNTTTIELQIAGNDRVHKTAFYAAEAARAYVRQQTALYHNDNITVGQGLNFPDSNDPSSTFSLNSKQSFNGDVGYLGHSPPPRGSGYDASKFRAHRYQMTCNGQGPNNAQSQVVA